MNPALARQLTQKFPRLFVHGNGWYQLLYDLASQLVALEPSEAALHVT